MIFRYTQFTFMVLAHFLYSIEICHAQPPCENMIQYPESPIHVEALNTTTTISSTQYAGDYALITAILSGSTYQITSSAGDYITVRDALTNNVLVHSVSPVSFTSSTDNDIHVHFNLNDNACGTEEVNRTTTITCTSCPPPSPPPCENTVQYPQESITPSPFSEPTTIASNQYAGEFAVITGINLGSSYQIISDAGDYITVRDAVSNNVLIHGVTPLSYTSTTSNDIELHFNLNDNACGIENVDRTTSITCTSCPSLCENTTQYPPNLISASPSNDLVTIAMDQYAGDFARITAIISGNTYQFASDAGDYITVRDATTNSVLTHGISPISYTPFTANDLEIHFNLNDNACGTEFVDRTTTVTCTSCPYSGPPPCENNEQFPQGSITAYSFSQPKIIAPDQYAGQFAVITGIMLANDYQFASDAGDYITVRDAVTNTVLTHGVSPISYTPTSSNDIELHFNLNDNACGTEDVGRTTTVTCTNCPPPHPPPCENDDQFPQESITASSFNEPTTIASNQYAGEFAVITGIMLANDYQFASDAGDYITVRDAVTNTVLTHGVSPISYTPTSSNDIELHFNLNDNACGTEDVGRTTTVTCTNCPPPPPPPSNDECSNPINLTSTLNSSCSFTTATFTSATVSTNPSVCFDDQEYPDIWFSFEALANTHVIEIANCQTPFDAVLFAIYEGSCISAELDCQVIELINFAGTYELQGLTSGSIYYLRMTDGTGSTTTMDICIRGAEICSTVVSSISSSGPGSLRAALSCVENGGVVTFAPAMNGQTVLLDIPTIVLNNELTILANPTDNITISNVNINNTNTLMQIQNAITLDGVKVVGQSAESMILHVDPGGAINLKSSDLEKVSINN